MKFNLWVIVLLLLATQVYAASAYKPQYSVNDLILVVIDFFFVMIVGMFRAFMEIAMPSDLDFVLVVIATLLSFVLAVITLLFLMVGLILRANRDNLRRGARMHF